MLALRMLSIVITVLSLTMFAQGQAALRQLVVVIPTAPPTLIHIPPYVALELGIFRKYGIDSRMLEVESGAVALRTLVAGRGSVHIAAPGVPPFIALAAQGGDVKAIGTPSMYHPVVLLVRGSLRTCEDLRGKRFGTPGGVGSYIEVMVRAVLGHCGLSARDVQYLNVTTAGRVPALVSGQIDGTVMALDQAYEAMRQHAQLRIFANLAELLPEGWYSAYITTGDIIRSQPDLLGDVLSFL